MNETIRILSTQFQLQEISKEEFIDRLPIDLKTNPLKLKELFLLTMDARNSEGLESALTVMWALGMEHEQVDLLNRLLLEPWHTRHEDIIHEIQRQKNPDSIPYIREAMQKRYGYLVEYGTGVRQFINQCGHALVSIGTREALEVVYDLSSSQDPVLQDEMLYRISRIEGTRYDRNDELED